MSMTQSNAEETIANDTSITGQDCIDALREGNYSKVAQFAHDVQEKYKKQGVSFAGEEFFYLLTYELCKTDINETDIRELNFLNNYIEKNNLYLGSMAWGLNQLIEKSAHALAVKAIPNVEEELTEIKPTTTEQVIEHCKSLIDLTGTHVKNAYNRYHQNIEEKMDNNQIYQQFQEKNISTFIQFQSDVRKKQGMQNFSCAILTFHNKLECISIIDSVITKLRKTKRSLIGITSLPDKEKKIVDILGSLKEKIETRYSNKASGSPSLELYAMLIMISELFDKEKNVLNDRGVKPDCYFTIVDSIVNYYDSYDLTSENTIVKKYESSAASSSQSIVNGYCMMFANNSTNQVDEKRESTNTMTFPK